MVGLQLMALISMIFQIFIIDIQRMKAQVWGTLILSLLAICTYTDFPKQYWTKQGSQLLAFLDENVQRISMLPGDRFYLEKLNKASNSRQIAIFNAKNLSMLIFQFSQSTQTRVYSKAMQDLVAVWQNNGSQIFLQDYRNFQVQFTLTGPFLKIGKYVYELEKDSSDPSKYLRIKFTNLQTRETDYIEEKLPRGDDDYSKSIFFDINQQFFSLFTESKVYFFDKKSLNLFQKLYFQGLTRGFRSIMSINIGDAILIAAEDNQNFQNIIFYSSQTKNFSLGSTRFQDDTNSLVFINNLLEARSMINQSLYKWRNLFNFKIESKSLDTSIFYRKALLGVFNNEKSFVLAESPYTNCIQYYGFDSNQLEVTSAFKIDLPANTKRKQNSRAIIVNSDDYLVLQVQVYNGLFDTSSICIINHINKTSYNLKEAESCSSFAVVDDDIIVLLCPFINEYKLKLVNIRTLDILDTYILSYGRMGILGNQGSILLIKEINYKTCSITLFRVEQEKIKKTQTAISDSQYKKIIICYKYMVVIQFYSQNQRCVEIYQIASLTKVKEYIYEKVNIDYFLDIECQKNILLISLSRKTEVFDLKQDIHNWQLGVYFSDRTLDQNYLSFDESKILYKFAPYSVTRQFYNLSQIPIVDVHKMVRYPSKYECQVYVPKIETTTQDKNLIGYAIFIDSTDKKIMKFTEKLDSQPDEITSFPFYPTQNFVYDGCIRIGKGNKHYFTVLYRGTKNSLIYYILEIRSYLQTDKLVWIYRSTDQILDAKLQEDGQISIFFKTKVKIYYLRQMILPNDFSMKQISRFDIQKNCSIFSGPDQHNSYVFRIVLQKFYYHSVDVLYDFEQLLLHQDCDSFALKRKNHFQVWKISDSLQKVYEQTLSSDMLIKSIKFAGKSKIAVEIDSPSQILIKDFSSNSQINFLTKSSSDKVKFDINSDGVYLAQTVDCCSVSILQLNAQTQIDRLKFNSSVTSLTFSNNNNSLLISTIDSLLYTYKTENCRQYSIRVNLTCQCLPGFTDKDGSCQCMDGYMQEEDHCQRCSSFCSGCQGPGLKCLSYSALFYVLVIGLITFIIIVVLIIIKVKRRRKNKMKKQTLLSQKENEGSLTESIISEKGKSNQ